MTAKTKQPQEDGVVSPYAAREKLREDIAKVRVARDTARGQLQRIDQELKEASVGALTAEQDVVLEVPGATERRDAQVERVAGCLKAQGEYERTLQATDELGLALEAKLERLYDEHFYEFVKEAESASCGCETELRILREQAARAAQSWSKASSLWRPLRGPLSARLEALNIVEGYWPNTIEQSMMRPFPVNSEVLASVSPRPSGIVRLRDAEHINHGQNGG